MRVLFVLSQRPELTGSGITVDALVRESAAAGHEPWVLCAVPAGQPPASVGGLPPERVLAVTFGPGGDLPFAVPGMSDVMPYPSTIWSAMSGNQLAAYRRIWRARLQAAVSASRPDVVHCNHLWLVASLLPEVLDTTGRPAGRIPSLVHCHATGLRQMQLCPHLRDQIIEPLRRSDIFLVPHAALARQVAATLDVPASRVVDVGAGYRQDLFHCNGLAADGDRRGRLLYAGKYAAAKGLPWLLDACETLWRRGVRSTLHVAGGGSGAESESLRARMASLAPSVNSTTREAPEGIVLHGRLDQAALGDLMRRVGALVLPSLYEGLPLVLVEARACGCRLVSTALGGVVTRLGPALGADLTLVEPPRLAGPDTPVAADLPAFTQRLAGALSQTLRKGPAGPIAQQQLAPFTWKAVFHRVESVWMGMMRSGHSAGGDR